MLLLRLHVPLGLGVSWLKGPSTGLTPDATPVQEPEHDWHAPQPQGMNWLHGLSHTARKQQENIFDSAHNLWLGRSRAWALEQAKTSQWQ